VILLWHTNKPHTNEYVDPDTGEKHIFQTYEARDAYLRKKELEKRIAPGANDSAPPRDAPGAPQPDGTRDAPAPPGQLPRQAPGPTDKPDAVDAPGATDPSKRIEAARKETPQQEQARRDAIKKYIDAGNKIRQIRKIEKHHIASDKDSNYTPKFKELFDNADTSLQDEANKVSLENHTGPHGPDYHKVVLQRLTDAVKGLTPHTQAYKDALLKALSGMKQELARPGSYLNQLVTK
jgi:hypothetical protein